MDLVFFVLLYISKFWPYSYLIVLKVYRAILNFNLSNLTQFLKISKAYQSTTCTRKNTGDWPVPLLKVQVSTSPVPTGSRSSCHGPAWARAGCRAPCYWWQFPYCWLPPEPAASVHCHLLDTPNHPAPHSQSRTSELPRLSETTLVTLLRSPCMCENALWSETCFITNLYDMTLKMQLHHNL